jgi:lycopene beta-cyclase
VIGVILVGGGLANSLIAYRLRIARPELSVQIVERDATLGGHHTWSFHTGDLLPAQRAWIAPLVERSWEGYEVRFPDLERRLAGGYDSVTSERLHAVVAGALGADARLRASVEDVAPDGVRVDGTRLAGACVIDGRGFPSEHPLLLGYQKFLGRRLILERPHGLRAPVLMDATVAQEGGFRFFYVLPWDDVSLLVEDTSYSDTPDLDRAHLRNEITRYAGAHGWAMREVLSEEEGVLPIPMGGSIEALLDQGTPGVPSVGMRAGLFHPTTGYSLPEAVRLADAIAAMPSLESAPLAAWVRRRAIERWRQGSFFRFLNRMLFKAAVPERRFQVLEHFYRLPEETIQRFYAGSLSTLDRFRLLTGKPPVPIARAARCLFESKLPA